MKNKASVLLKQILAVVSSLVKVKSMAAAKTKSSAIKTRFIIFSLMKNKKVLMGSVSQKIQALLAGSGGGNHNHHIHQEDQTKAIVLYNAMNNNSINSEMMMMSNSTTNTTHDQSLLLMSKYDNIQGNHIDHDEDKYPDLTHTLFDSDCEDFDDQTGSVIDLVRNSKEDEGKDFSLEDEIDHVADLFIRRFHRQIKMQKQESFNRYQEMLERSV